MHIAPDFIPRASVLVRPGGAVIPPDHIVRRLKAKSPRLGLQWFTGAHIPYWGITQEWGPEDPRWEKVQNGSYPREKAYDIAHIFRLDVSTEDMAAYIEQRWSESAHRKTGGEAAKEASATVEAQHDQQEAVRAAHVERVTQASLERHERESRHDLRVRAGAEAAHPMIIVP